MGQERIGDVDLSETESYATIGPLQWFFGGLMIAIGVVTSILMFRDFQSDSYLYLGFYSIPANTAISLFPHEPVLIYFGKVGDLWLTAVWATAGTFVAGIMDHLVFVPVLNLQSTSAYKDKKFYQKAVGYFNRWPFATILVAGFTPIPFFPFKFLCFSVGYPMWKYVTALLVARFPRYYIYAWVGSTVPIPNWVLIASVVVIFTLYGIKGVPAGAAHLKARRAKRRASQETS